MRGEAATMRNLRLGFFKVIWFQNIDGGRERSKLTFVYPQLKVYVSIHAYSQMWLMPWSFESPEPPYNYQDLKEVGQQAIAALREHNGTAYVA